MKVLFLTSWYPSKNAPIEGIFIKKHARALAQHCDVAVLSIQFKSEENYSDYHMDQGIHDMIRSHAKGQTTGEILHIGRYL